MVDVLESFFYKGKIYSGPKCLLCNGSKKSELKCGQSFDIGKHYKFIFKEAIDNDVPSPGTVFICLSIVVLTILFIWLLLCRQSCLFVYCCVDNLVYLSIVVSTILFICLSIVVLTILFICLLLCRQSYLFVFLLLCRQSYLFVFLLLCRQSYLSFYCCVYNLVYFSVVFIFLM